MLHQEASYPLCCSILFINEMRGISMPLFFS
jgi:hypothetical protein